ncbi:hypothetical protein ANOM_001663 [Aspergillus nomiae NRRL 13137]|uniref:Uncharacterized protein n=1 Tax=Aspergillus nomiae NRRL (strain ATCC 15546 / NRRL 13137 / CBS 260.88 / M93) TaxID=1509407 RepID=A0A0L1JCX4_ASPN3|nr:uncharacterized protein ANOM_001663 [Aspergillus nomiae NRRL 13137]KNG89273.1 hypothetical protein ANOM_001663 [Aspergillus nomiae NRRL 13137]
MSRQPCLVDTTRIFTLSTSVLLARYFSSSTTAAMSNPFAKGAVNSVGESARKSNSPEHRPMSKFATHRKLGRCQLTWHLANHRMGLLLPLLYFNGIGIGFELEQGWGGDNG